jgi:hypothetical protein
VVWLGVQAVSLRLPRHSMRYREDHNVTVASDDTMKIVRRGSAQWQGGIKDGMGAISTESGALKNYPYGFASRFDGQPATPKNFWRLPMPAVSRWHYP